jgi:hypothetical protein
MHDSAFLVHPPPPNSTITEHVVFNALAVYILLVIK